MQKYPPGGEFREISKGRSTPERKMLTPQTVIQPFEALLHSEGVFLSRKQNAVAVGTVRLPTFRGTLSECRSMLIHATENAFQTGLRSLVFIIERRFMMQRMGTEAMNGNFFRKHDEGVMASELNPSKTLIK